jgi:hypothetical protein
MSKGPSASDHDLPLGALERIDRICIEFEAAWKAGDGPRIEAFLGAGPGSTSPRAEP